MKPSFWLPAVCGGCALLLGLLFGSAVSPPPALASAAPAPAHSSAPSASDAGSAPAFTSWSSMAETMSRFRRQRMPRSLQRQFLLESMLAIFAKDGCDDTAFSAAWELTGIDSRSLLSSVRLEALAKLRPDDFVAITSRNGGDLAGDAEDALGGLASSEPVRAFNLLTRLKSAGIRGLSGQQIFEAWARSDPAAALATAREMRTAPEREAALAATLRGWMREDPAAALPELAAAYSSNTGVPLVPHSDKLPPPEVEWAGEIGWSLTKNPDPAALTAKMISAVKSSDLMIMAGAAFSAMAAQDAGMAVRAWHLQSDSLIAMTRGSPSGAALNGLLEGLAWRSPSAAMDFLLDPGTADRFRKSLGRGLSFSGFYDDTADMMAGPSPDAAAALARKLLSKSGGLDPEEEIASALAVRAAFGSEASRMEILAGIGPEFVRSQVIGNVSTLLVNAGEMDAAALLRLLPTPYMRAYAAESYVAHLTTVDAKFALKWVSANENEFPGSAKVLFEHWGASDPAGASEMISALSPAEQQQFIPGLAVGLATREPAAAIAWATSMTDSAARAETLAAIGRTSGMMFGRVEPLLASDQLSPEDKEIITTAWTAGRKKQTR